MRYKFIKEVTEPVKGYSGNTLMTGDVIELDAYFSEKAEKNPNYERASDVTQDDGSEVFVAKKVTKKKKRGY